MNKRNMSIIFIFVCILMSLFLYGCETQKINFYRESRAAKAFQQASSGAPVEKKVLKASNMLIYRMGENSSSQSQGVQFGPKGLNFDLPIKF